MPAARDAKEWAASGGLHGIGNSLYTPFSGTDGDDIDYDAYRALVRYCVGDLGHAMLWLTSGIAEWWSLTIDERKQLLEVAVEEARAIAPDTVIQACTSATSAKDCVELTQHAEAHGADICYLQTPPMEVHAGEGVLRFFQYVADRTDIALGLFNSASSGYVLTPEEVAQIANEIPAVCAMKEGMMEPWRSKAAHALAPGLVIWECDTHRVQGGMAAAGHRRPRAARHRRLPLRDAREADAHQLLDAGLGGSPRRGHRVRPGDRPRPDQRGDRRLVHALPGTARLLHALGRGVPVRGVRHRPAGRRLPALAAAAGHPAGGRQGADPQGVREGRVRQAARRRVAAPIRPTSSRGHHAEGHPRAHERPRGVRRRARAALDGLLSYRYIGRNHSSMNTGAVDNTVTLRRDMRNAAGGLLVAPLSISAPEGDVGSDLVAVPNPVIHSCLILDDAHDVTRIEVVDSEMLRSGARMGYSRSKIVDADDHDRVIAFTEGQGVRIGTLPRGSRRCPRPSSRSSTHPTCRRCGRRSARSCRDDGHWVLPELSVELASPDAALHIGPQHVVLETAAIDLAAELVGTDMLQMQAWHVMFLARGKVGPLPGRGRGGARHRGQGRGAHGPPRRGRPRSSGHRRRRRCSRSSGSSWNQSRDSLCEFSRWARLTAQ